MSDEGAALTQRERRPIRFGFRYQAILLTLGLLVGGVLSLSILIERTIRNSYQELFAEQFSVQADSILKGTQEDALQASELIIDTTLNPRLIAALEVGINDYYERFFYDAIEAFRTTLEQYDRPSFITLIEPEGIIYAPMRAETPSIMLHSKQLQSIQAQLLEIFEGQLPEEDPISALWCPEDDHTNLFLVTVHPINTYYGEPLGHLIFGQPYTIQAPLNGREAVFKITLQDNLQNIADEALTDEALWYTFNVPLEQPTPFEPANLQAEFSPEEFESLSGNIRSSIISFAAVAVAIGLVVSIKGSSSLTQPIESLVEASDQVQSGDFSTRINKHRNDEWGQLTVAFNDMTEGLQTREKYRAVLNKVTDPSVAQLLTRGKIELGGEMREATVLFCDIRGFTPLTQDMDPRDVIQMLNEHMSKLTEIVQAHGGVVDKFVGDEIMALFGVPKSYGNDALSAVQCAKKMLEARTILNHKSEGPPIHIGIGISTGPLVAGCMGSDDRLSYTVLGATVNLGARLCGKADPGVCLIDEATHTRVNGKEATTFSDDIAVKGFSKPIPVFTVS